MRLKAIIPMVVAALLLMLACGQGSTPSPIIIVATPTPIVSDGSVQRGQPAGAQLATQYHGAQPQEPKLKNWTRQQHAAADKAIQEAYSVFAKDLDECIKEMGEPEGGPFPDDLARYESAATQSPYLECIQGKLSQGQSP